MVAALIADLEAAGARLSIRDGALAVKGPRAALTPERVAAIRANRTDLLATLAAPVENVGQADAPDSPAVQLIGEGVIVTGLDLASRHRVMCAIASHHWAPVRRVATRHDYAGGVLSIAAPGVKARRLAVVDLDSLPALLELVEGIVYGGATDGHDARIRRIVP